jgi:SAM-dependent methyltransferase
MTELDLIIELHRDTQRQGPGSLESTIKALNSVDLDTNASLLIADIGCGTGGHTLELARTFESAQITAIDLFPIFLDRLNLQAAEAGLGDRIRTLEASMDDLPFEQESLDMIWSEGAIYNMGFKNGIAYWAQFLKPNGWLAVSEITWATEERPAELDEFWMAEYPEVALPSEKIEQLKEAGFDVIDYFMLPKSDWVQYYDELSERIKDFERQFATHQDADVKEMAAGIADAYRGEINQYKQFSDYYSYGFYIALKGR